MSRRCTSPQVAAVSLPKNWNQGKAFHPCASCAFCGKSCIGFSIKEPEAASMYFMVNPAAVAAVSKRLNPNQCKASGPCASCAFCGKSCIGFSIKEPEAAFMSSMYFMVNPAAVAAVSESLIRACITCADKASFPADAF
jgi:hypothetical protein